MCVCLRVAASEKHVIDLTFFRRVRQLDFFAVGRRAVQLSDHLPWMRREQQNPVADLDGLGDRMGHEHHGEAGVG